MSAKLSEIDRRIAELEALIGSDEDDDDDSDKDGDEIESSSDDNAGRNVTSSRKRPRSGTGGGGGGGGDDAKHSKENKQKKKKKKRKKKKKQSKDKKNKKRRRKGTESESSDSDYESDDEQDAGEELERIPALPAHLLPAPGMSKMYVEEDSEGKVIRFSKPIVHDKEKKKKEKQKRKKEKKDKLENDKKRVSDATPKKEGKFFKACDICTNITCHSEEEWAKHKRSMLHRQKIVLIAGAAYTPSQHRSNYCRVCAKQFETSDELFEHRKTEEHKDQVRKDRKASYCHVCRKQFTSAAQLREHIKGKAHQEILQSWNQQK